MLLAMKERHTVYCFNLSTSNVQTAKFPRRSTTAEVEGEVSVSPLVQMHHVKYKLSKTFPNFAGSCICVGHRLEEIITNLSRYSIWWIVDIGLKPT